MVHRERSLSSMTAATVQMDTTSAEVEAQHQTARDKWLSKAQIARAGTPDDFKPERRFLSSSYEHARRTSALFHQIAKNELDAERMRMSECDFSMAEPQNEKSMRRPLSEVTGCFGEIEFEGSDSLRQAPRYVCFNGATDATDVRDVFKVLTEGWKLKKPSVLLSVTGSAADFDLEPRLKDLLKQGLAMSATCADAWMLTGGINVGVMALVGQVLSDPKYITEEPQSALPIIGARGAE